MMNKNDVMQFANNPKGSRPASAGQLPLRLLRRFVIPAFVVIVALSVFSQGSPNPRPAYLSLKTQVANINLRCKYSVRDVAFVNVHGKAWQLQLVKPDNVDEDEFQHWNRVLQVKLERSNVGHIWFESDSAEARSVAGYFEESSELPQMVMRNETGWVLPVLPELTFEATIDNLLDSELRQEVLGHVVNSLCVFMFVESSSPAKNAAALEVVKAAAEQVKRQMWTLEKPTDEGPALVVIKHEHAQSESLALESLGISIDTEPKLAIVYGQVRRLGEVLSGKDLSAEKIVGRASVCGGDCECDLNRDWLYGQQMVHVWSQDLEWSAESTLNFDPNSAFVMAEVSQIIQKNSRDDLDSNRVDLGGGLVIHDLDSGNPIASKTVDPTSSETEKELPLLESADELEPIQPEIVMPWRLFLILGGISIAAFVFFLARLT